MIISLDTESTGFDWAHGAKPYLVSTCDDEGTTRFWEWDVDPLTRQPVIPSEDLEAVAELIDAADLIYLHNAKFDAHMLDVIGLSLPWPKVRDTLAASHLLATNHGHRLDQVCVEYLEEDIEHYEVAVREVTRRCRAIAKEHFPDWNLADEGKPGMPSVKASSDREEDKPWKNDMWLPRALALASEKVNPFRLKDSDAPNKSWLEVTSAYSNADSRYTLMVGLEMERLIRERGHWAIYEHRLQVVRAYYEMERRGITARGDYTEATSAEYEQHVAEAEAALTEIAAGFGHELELAKGASLNDNMRDFFYGRVHQTCLYCSYSKRVKHWMPDCEPALPTDLCPKCLARKRNPRKTVLQLSKAANLALPLVFNGKAKGPSLDKDSIVHYITTLDDGPALDFVELLADKRMYDTALTYMAAYRRFWVPVPSAPGFYRIHASLNPCGTDHLRAASNSPNMQNVSGEARELSNRACFGPAPGREWWSMDYKSIEARLPAYESGEPKMIEVFEKPNEPPYWGNLYNLTASVLYKDDYWPLCEKEGLFRERHPRLYKRAKFFVLAKNYGAGRKRGDLLSGIKDSYDMVDGEFPRLAALQRRYLVDAERLGYVETIPDRTVDPKRGYPILAAQTEEGRVLSTTPFNYHISGTACWCKNTGLVRCTEQFERWRAEEGFDAWVSLEVHDELLFDFPRGRDLEENLPRALALRRLMEQSGEDLVPSIPTPVSVEYRTESWAKGVKI